jgi:death-on-curing protein
VTKEPRWLLFQAVLAIHTQQLAEHGGGEGIRDKGVLESALQRPVNKHAYGEEDIFNLAGAYACGIARNHAFVDGNKRVAYVASRAFLLINGYRLTAPKNQRYETFIKLAAGEITEEQLAAWFRSNAVRR